MDREEGLNLRLLAKVSSYTFNFDWNQHVKKLFQETDSLMAEIMEDSVVECLMAKEKDLWDIYATNFIACNALLLCSTVNHSFIIPVGDLQNKRVISATVVWVANDQARISVPDAITHLQQLADEDSDGVALCFIPDTKPYFPYPDNGPHMMVLTTDTSKIPELAAGTPPDFTPYFTTTYIDGAHCNVGLTSRLRYGINQPVTEVEERSVHFLQAKPRERMWENHVFVEETLNGPAPVAHVVYLGAGAIAGLAKVVPNAPPTTQLTAQDLLKQNPTLASCLQEAKSAGDDTAIVALPGNTEMVMVSKALWPSSSSSSSTTTSTITRATPVSLASGTPIKTMSSTSASGSNQQQSKSTRPAIKTEPLEPDERRQLASEDIADEVKTLSEAARILSMDFVMISLATHTYWCEMRNRHLQGVNTMRRKIQAAMLEWKTQISADQRLLQLAPLVNIYNGIIEDIWVETFELTSAIGSAMGEYEESQGMTTTDMEKMRVRFLNELQLMIESAISRFIDDASTSLYTKFETLLMWYHSWQTWQGSLPISDLSCSV